MDDRLVTMQIWDTAGQEKYQSVQRVFYRGTDGCAIVYDITNPLSFQNVAKWKEEFFNSASLSNVESFPLVLIGNKADLAAERKVDSRTNFEGPLRQGRPMVQGQRRYRLLRDLRQNSRQR